MTLTQEQLELRKAGIGASEVAAVCGVDPFRNALDVFLEKTGQTEPFQGNEFTEWGNRLEGVIADAYADRMGVELETSGTVVGPCDWMFATPDRLVVTAPKDRGVEVKNRNYFNWKEWGDPGTDEAPIEVVAQCQWTMAVTGKKKWDIAVLLGGNRLGIYHLDFDEAIAKQMIERVDTFWHENVLARVVPELDGSETSRQYLNDKWKLYGENLKAPDAETLTNALRLRDIKARLKSDETEKKVLENLIKDFIGNDLGLDLDDAGRITWKRPKASVVTKWEMVAVGLSHGRKKLHDQLVDLHSEDKGNPRRFLAQFNKEKR
jgi:putative phage-type endonuclease